MDGLEGGATEDPAGGAPPAGEPAAPQGPPAGHPETPEPTAAPQTPALPDELEATFRLDEVPEGAREHVQRYIDSARPAVSRAFQSAAEQRREAEQAVALYERLHSPDSRLEALNELLAEHDLELDPSLLDPAAGEPVPTGEGEVDEHGIPVTEDPALQYLLERERQRETQDQEAAEAKTVERMTEHVETTLKSLADEKSRELTPEEDRAIRSICLSLPLKDDGLPNIEAAVDQFKALEAMSVQSYLRSRGGPEPPAGGGPGVKKIDVSTPQSRLEAANAVASRHVG